MESTHQSEAVHKLESCISDVRSWAIQNKLMLNDSKTEIIHFHSAFRTNSVLPSINIGGSDIAASLSAKDLGVLLDDTLQLKTMFAMCVVKHLSVFIRSDAFVNI